MRISVIVPSKGCVYLKYLLFGLREQSVRPNEVILVLKECDVKSVEELCRMYSLSCVIIEQKKGYFTHALNIGKKEASGDILIFTDNDVIPLKKWVQKYITLHRKYQKIAGICSRDIYLDLKNKKLLPTPDDKPTVRLYRWLARTWLEPPYPLFKKYRLGVYLTRKLDIAHGPHIPGKTCYSLPLRGVNMSFKQEYVYDVWFPEHPGLKRALGNEQFFGIQLVLKGFDTMYTPYNPVLHITREESLSRTAVREEVGLEFKVMRSLYRDLLNTYGYSL